MGFVHLWPAYVFDKDLDTTICFLDLYEFLYDLSVVVTHFLRPVILRAFFPGAVPNQLPMPFQPLSRQGPRGFAGISSGFGGRSGLLLWTQGLP